MDSTVIYTCEIDCSYNGLFAKLIELKFCVTIFDDYFLLTFEVILYQEKPFISSSSLIKLQTTTTLKL